MDSPTRESVLVVEQAAELVCIRHDAPRSPSSPALRPFAARHGMSAGFPMPNLSRGRGRVLHHRAALAAARASFKRWRARLAPWRRRQISRCAAHSAEHVFTWGATSSRACGISAWHIEQSIGTPPCRVGYRVYGNRGR